MTAKTQLTEAADEIVARIEALPAGAQRAWGTMTLPQMLAHCTEALRMTRGELAIRQMFAGRILGGLAKRIFVRGRRGFGKSAPTHPRLLSAKAEDVAGEKERLVEEVRRYAREGPDTSKPHPFFGRMTRDEWEHLAWKHLDHHLRQFSG